jgi:hypothetical protein
MSPSGGVAGCRLGWCSQQRRDVRRVGCRVLASFAVGSVATLLPPVSCPVWQETRR